ncbi:unnamed protein product [Pleuronectes platessa]|uniref:Uncharacterized protein n=1 Tax=Pleuronectes platessa TaxID=8262 RepID=A0A9N7YX05_PLEPL|nr:unnamed protein product [Pleuronectes platessa]
MKTQSGGPSQAHFRPSWSDHQTEPRERYERNLHMMSWKGCRSRATAVATSSWIAICGSRVRGRGGGSSVVDSMLCRLIVVGMADSLSCWSEIMVVDHDRGGS